MTERFSYVEPTNPVFDTPQLAFSAGVEYSKTFLAAPLSQLSNRVDSFVKQLEIDPSQLTFFFLDRDARACLHAWQSLSHGKFRSLPIPLSRAQVPNLSSVVESALDLQEIRLAHAEADFAELFKDAYSQSVDTKPWLEALKRLLLRSLKNQKAVFIVDTGYLGSAVELVRYLIKQVYPEITCLPYLLYGSDKGVTERALPNQATHFGNLETAPSATTAFYLSGLNSDEVIHYLRGKSDLEVAFMRGVKSVFE